MASLRTTGLLLTLLLAPPAMARPQPRWLTWPWLPGWLLGPTEAPTEATAEATTEAKPEAGWLTWSWLPSPIEVLDTINDGLDSVVGNIDEVQDKFSHTEKQIDTLVNSLGDLGTLFSLLTNSKAKANRRLELVENLDAVKNLVDNIAAPTENLVASLAEMEELVARIAGPVKQLLDSLPQPLKDLMDESASRKEGLAEESASMEGLLEEIFT